MSGYVVTRGGTFGRVVRTYRNEDGVPMCVIQWGPLNWITPVYAADVFALSSKYESKARQEAKLILKKLGQTPCE